MTTLGVLVQLSTVHATTVYYTVPQYCSVSYYPGCIIIFAGGTGLPVFIRQGTRYIFKFPIPLFNQIITAGTHLCVHIQLNLNLTIFCDAFVSHCFTPPSV
eukprot:SAG11_NODE_1600_length_4608_cov_3.690397_4_plen_101_part_00